MKILFVHGAGGWVDDQPMADELRTRVAVEVAMPRFPDTDMSAAAWRAVLDQQLETQGPDTVIVGHSFGASMLLLRLADDWPGHPLPLGFVLAATPYWGSEGWQAEYALPADFTAPADVPIVFHHCRDDATVPVEHLARFESLVPRALIRRHDSGGHQFEGQMAAVAADVFSLDG